MFLAKPAGLTPRTESAAVANTAGNSTAKSPAKNVGKSPAKLAAAEKPVETAKPKAETKGKVELKKESGSFGFSLVGGADTPLVYLSF